MAKNLTNPFQPIADENKPKVEETNYHTENDDYIIEYGVVQKVKMTGEKDTDFIITDEVVETNRVKRQEYIDSFRDDVGILNIINKVALSGDVTLFNQTGRVSLPGVEKDALGRPVEAVVDVTKYQVDTITALESYKKGSLAFDDLDPELKKKLSFDAVAHLTDAEIDAYLTQLGAAIKARKAENVEEGGSN